MHKFKRFFKKKRFSVVRSVNQVYPLFSIKMRHWEKILKERRRLKRKERKARILAAKQQRENEKSKRNLSSQKTTKQLMIQNTLDVHHRDGKKTVTRKNDRQKN